jgi:hypothetical protein
MKLWSIVKIVSFLLFIMRYNPIPIFCKINERHKVDELCRHSLWWKQNSRIAVQIRNGIAGISKHVATRLWWNIK